MAYFTSSEDARDAGVTYHLIPAEVWSSVQGQAEYVPDAFGTDGFIHCTNGIDQLVTVANWFYVPDPRSFKALALEVAAINSDVQYDDAEELFPHIYGPLNLDAVIAVFEVTRAEDGAFVAVIPAA